MIRIEDGAKIISSCKSRTRVQTAFRKEHELFRRVPSGVLTLLATLD